MNNDQHSTRPQQTLVAITLIVLVLRLCVASLMPLGVDEAYYYAYINHPALSYFDHPPLVALIGSVFPSITGISSPLTLRLGTIMLFTGAIYTFYRTTKLLLDQHTALFAAGTLTVIPMFFLVSGTMLLPDAALVTFWIAGLFFVVRTLQQPSWTNWLLLGVSGGMALLAKYTAGFLFIGGLLYLMLAKNHRSLLLSLKPYVCVLVAGLLFSPVLIWNLQHNFASFAFHFGRAGSSEIDLTYFYQLLIGNLAYLLPFFFFPALYYCGKYTVHLLISLYQQGTTILYTPLSEEDSNAQNASEDSSQKIQIDLFLFCFGAFPVLVFLYVSLYDRVLPHWPIIGYTTLCIPVGAMYKRLFQSRPRIGYALLGGHGLLTITLMTLGLLQIYKGTLINKNIRKPDGTIEKEEGDFSTKIIGWEKLQQYLDNQKQTDDAFLWTHRWELAGQIEYATRGQYPLLCLSKREDARGYAIWQNQQSFLGQNGLFITTSQYYTDPHQQYGTHFDRFELLRKIPVRRSDTLVNIIYVFRGYQFSRPYPVK